MNGVHEGLLRRQHPWLVNLRWKGRGDIYNKEFMDDLRKATDDVFFIPGIKPHPRPPPCSPPTPGYLEITEDGLPRRAGGAGQSSAANRTRSWRRVRHTNVHPCPARSALPGRQRPSRAPLNPRRPAGTSDPQCPAATRCAWTTGRCRKKLEEIRRPLRESQQVRLQDQAGAGARSRARRRGRRRLCGLRLGRSATRPFQGIPKNEKTAKPAKRSPVKGQRRQPWRRWKKPRVQRQRRDQTSSAFAPFCPGRRHQGPALGVFTFLSGLGLQSSPWPCCYWYTRAPPRLTLTALVVALAAGAVADRHPAADRLSASIRCRSWCPS